MKNINVLRVIVCFNIFVLENTGAMLYANDTYF